MLRYSQHFCNDIDIMTLSQRSHNSELLAGQYGCNLIIREHELLTFLDTIYKQTQPVSLVIYNLFTNKIILLNQPVVKLSPYNICNRISSVQCSLFYKATQTKDHLAYKITVKYLSL